MEYHKATLKNVIYTVIYSMSSIKGEKNKNSKSAPLRYKGNRDSGTKGTGIVDTQYDPFLERAKSREIRAKNILKYRGKMTRTGKRLCNLYLCQLL